MDVREEFVLRAQAPKANKAALCREFGISRKTAYKWLERYVSGGLGALESLSRRPSTSPLRCSGDVVAEVVRIRREHPSWGARKIAAVIRRERPALEPYLCHVAPVSPNRVWLQGPPRNECGPSARRVAAGLTSQFTA